jgi:hypothetical protein
MKPRFETGLRIIRGNRGRISIYPSASWAKTPEFRHSFTIPGACRWVMAGALVGLICFFANRCQISVGTRQVRMCSSFCLCEGTPALVAIPVKTALYFRSRQLPDAVKFNAGGQQTELNSYREKELLINAGHD